MELNYAYDNVMNTPKTAPLSNNDGDSRREAEKLREIVALASGATTRPTATALPHVAY
jgi:hypothetical protein